jgi:hypothetical protein
MSGTPNTVRKKIKWSTGKRKCGARVWKSKWITVHTPPKDKVEKKAAKAG